MGTGQPIFEIPEINFNPIVNPAEPPLEVGAFNAPLFEIQEINFTPMVIKAEDPLEVGAWRREATRQPAYL